MSDKTVPGASADELMEVTPPPVTNSPTEDICMEATDMFEVAENIVIPPLMSPLPEPLSLKPMEDKPQPWIHKHAPGNYYFFCWCDDCRRFFGTGKPIQCVDPSTLQVPDRPRYSYMALVNSMRAASARREEERQNRRLAESEQAGGEQSPKKSKTTKTPKKKNLRQTIKRRRL